MSSTPALTPDQIDQLRRLGIAIPDSTPTSSPNSISQPIPNLSDEIKTDQILPPTTGQISISLPSSTTAISLPTPNDSLDVRADSYIRPSSKSASLLPVFSISGLTLLSFGGLVLLKSKTTASIVPPPSNPPSASSPVVTPTQVPKSIQHYLLASQQYFSQALQIQQTARAAASTPDQSEIAATLNQSIQTATDAIQEFPGDYRGYQQRATIYQSLIDSQPQYMEAAVADFTKAVALNPGSSELTHTLAALYAKKGDSVNTIALLSRTVAIEPTKPQNFYDLARIQQQAGQLSSALDTYNHLITIIADPAQKTEIQSTIDSLQKLINQNPNHATVQLSPTPTISPPISLPADGRLLQADTGSSSLIIAAPAVSSSINVNNLSESNALSGTATLPAGQKEFTLTNYNISAGSQVYVAIVSGGKNQNLQVLSRDGQNFTVGLDSPISEEIKFKWWVVNP